MPQVSNTTVHDVVVVGSGAGGGTVTNVLANMGISVLLLEAGPMISIADFKEHMWPYNVPHRGAGPKGQAYFNQPTGFTYSATFGGSQLDGEPYTVAPGSDFSWFRSRVLGGRTNHYGRVTLRMADYDFKPKTTDGLGFDWPISYNDIAPYYEKAERFIGVTGSVENIRSAPDSIFNPPAPLRAHDVLVQRACAKNGIRAVAARQAVTTVPRNGRPACHYCGQCGRGCTTASNYAASYVQIFPAMKTGKVQVVANAMARELVTDATGKVIAVSYIDKTDGTEKQVRCRTVVLAASACESARLLLNSKSSRHPQGLANSSGKVGRYLMDTVGASITGQIPALEDLPPHNEDGAGGIHAYSPWWLYRDQLAGKMDFARGYHIEINVGRRMPGFGSMSGLSSFVGGYGRKFKQDMRRYYGSFVNLSGRGEMIPNEDSYCEIDPHSKDRWGIPALRFHWKWSDHETRQALHMQRTFAQVIEAMGGKVLDKVETDGRKAIAPGGYIIHEIGGAIMGSDPKTSVVNQWCQTWDVKNLFLTDGAPFPSNADKNPTLTIMALAWRAADYMLAAMQRREL
jgi:choline dehydrogenase-like flavoprotein